MFSRPKWGLELGKERPNWLSVGCGCLDYIGREKKMNFIISIGASEPAIISVWESVSSTKRRAKILFGGAGLTF